MQESDGMRQRFKSEASTTNWAEVAVVRAD